MTQETFSAAAWRAANRLPAPGADRAKPPRAKRVQSESALQVEVATWFRELMGLEAVPLHIPNGERRDVLTAARLQAMGVLPGAPDWAVPIAGGRTLWLELKVAGGSLSKEQRDFRDRVSSLGHIHAVCRSIEDVYQQLRAAGVRFAESPIAKGRRTG